MASTSEGRNAIEAAKLRLAAAKSQTLATSKTLASAEASEACAKQMAEAAATTTRNAKEQAESCRKEMEEAEKFLKEAEERWEVIEVDDDDVEIGEKDDRRSAKRRKVSLSPAGNNNDNASSAVSPTVTTPHTAQQSSSDDLTRVSIIRGNDLREGNNTVNGNNDQVDATILVRDIITVEGCGDRSLNGQYKQIWSKSDGAPVFVMGRKGMLLRDIHPCTGTKAWFLVRHDLMTNARIRDYEAFGDGDLPPKVRWMANSKDPAPQLKW